MDILVAEDDLISRSFLQNMLTRLGHRVTTADDGLHAWQLLEQHNMPMVITDWMMPEMDGIALCRRIRARANGRYTYVLVLTAKDGKSDLLDVFQAGADDYIPKPFDPDELSVRIKTGERIIALEQKHTKFGNMLMESRNKLRIVLDALEEEIVAVERQCRVVSVNQAYLQTRGTTHEDVVGWAFFTDPQQDGDLYKKVRQAFDDGRAVSFLDESADASGETVIRQTQLLPVKEGNGGVIQVVIVSKDITEERRRTQEIQSLNAALESAWGVLNEKNASLEKVLSQLKQTQTQIIQSEKMASIGQLAAGVAHEINNPTGFVSSNLKTLQDYQADLAALIDLYGQLKGQLQRPEAAAVLPAAAAGKLVEVEAFEKRIDLAYLQGDVIELIRESREGTDRIKKIVEDLKAFAHPGEEQMKVADINQGLESTLNVIHNELRYKAKLVKELGDLPPIKCNPQQLNQVFMNILVNAAQAIETCGQITIGTKFEDEAAVVTISDTGCGISPENLTRIFDPFYTTKPVGKGTGLGMHIAYNIVQKHNGTITVDSEVGKGTTFTIRLPVEK